MSQKAVGEGRVRDTIPAKARIVEVGAGTRKNVYSLSLSSQEKNGNHRGKGGVNLQDFTL